MTARIPVKSYRILLLLKKIIFYLKKRNSLYLGLVPPSGGWQSLIALGRF